MHIGPERAEGGGCHSGARGEGEWIDGSRRVGPAWVATSEATTESEGGPSREDPRPERAAAGTKGVKLGEPPSSHASEGPEAAVEIPAEAQGPSPLESSRDVLSEEKKVPSDCWWIVTDKEALGNFSMFEHELRSHLPFSSSCEVCLRARGLKPALRRSQVHEHEVQLDQFWHGSLRVLIMVHSRSFAIGCVSGDMTRDMIVAGMSQWMLHFGLANKSCVFTCHAEGYMRTLWHDMLEQFPVFQGTVEQFAPGRHAPVAERGVRALRETVSGILIQMQDKGMGLRNNRKAFNFVFQHGCHCHNRYSMLSGSALTPIQRLRGNQHKPHQAYVFGSTILISGPPSKAASIPGRYTYGAYLGPVLGKASHWATMQIKPGTVEVVQTPSVKALLPTRYDLELLGMLAKKVGSMVQDVAFCHALTCHKWISCGFLVNQRMNRCSGKEC